MTKGRLEAFSDGVFAIAITLLVLEIRVPDPSELDGHPLSNYLTTHSWSYAGYGLSFVFIGIMWVNHHTLFDHVRIVDRTLTLLNLLLLGFVALVPWPTGLVARYINGAHRDAVSAMAVYSALTVCLACSFTSIWWWMTRGPQLLADGHDYRVLQKTRGRFALGVYVYSAVLVVGFFFPYAALALQGLVALYYVGNQLSTDHLTDDATGADARVRSQ